MLRAMSCLVVVAAVASAAAAAGLSARFNADLHGSTTPFHADIVTKCFGSSHAATALTADWQAQLAKVRREIGSEYVRFHGLLDDGRPVLRWPPPSYPALFIWIVTVVETHVADVTHPHNTLRGSHRMRLGTCCGSSACEPCT